jgi:hypothetical protein
MPAQPPLLPCTGEEPWLQAALLLMAERSGPGVSDWAQYVASLPEQTGSPLQWSESARSELVGTQAGGMLDSYR